MYQVTDRLKAALGVAAAALHLGPRASPVCPRAQQVNDGIDGASEGQQKRKYYIPECLF